MNIGSSIEIGVITKKTLKAPKFKIACCSKVLAITLGAMIGKDNILIKGYVFRYKLEIV